MKKFLYVLSCFVFSLFLFSCTLESNKEAKNPYDQAVKDGFKGDVVDWLKSLDSEDSYRFKIDESIIYVKDASESEWMELSSLEDLVDVTEPEFRFNIGYIQYKAKNSNKWLYLLYCDDLLGYDYYRINYEDGVINIKYNKDDEWELFIDLNTLNGKDPDPMTGLYDGEAIEYKDETQKVEFYFLNEESITTIINLYHIQDIYEEIYGDSYFDDNAEKFLIDFYTGNLYPDQDITVTFEYDGNVVGKQEKLEYGDFVKEPGDLVNEDEGTFLGWYYYDLPWDFEECSVISDITLQAKFGIVKNINYIMEYGTLPEDAQTTRIVGEEYELPKPIVTESNVKFLFWKNAETGETVYTIPADYEEDITLEAVYNVSDNTIPTLDTTNPITIEFWHAMGQRNYDVIRRIVEEFNVYYPNITVEVVSMGDYTTLRDTIAGSIAAGMQPTIAQTYPDHVSLYLQASAVAELNSYLSSEVQVLLSDGTYDKVGISEAEQNQYISGFWEEGKMYDTLGTMYSLPFNKSTEVLYYNKTIFDKYGYEVPETWDDIIKIAEDYVTRPEYMNTYNSFVLSADSLPNLFITLTQQWGGKFTDFDENGNGVYAFNSYESKDAIRFYKENHDRKYFATATDFGVDYSSEAFLAQQCIMTIGSSAGASYHQPRDYSFEVGVTAYPQKDMNNPQVIQQGTNVSLFECVNPQEELAGWLFMKFLTNFNSSLTWATETGYMPTRVDVLNSEEYQNYLNGIGVDGLPIYTNNLTTAAQKVALTQQSWFYVNAVFNGSSAARDNVEILFNSILYGNKSIDDAYNDAIRNLLY